jgi:hypothetical protein
MGELPFQCPVGIDCIEVVVIVTHVDRAVCSNGRRGIDKRIGEELPPNDSVRTAIWTSSGIEVVLPESGPGRYLQTVWTQLRSFLGEIASLMASRRPRLAKYTKVQAKEDWKQTPA